MNLPTRRTTTAQRIDNAVQAWQAPAAALERLTADERAEAMRRLGYRPSPHLFGLAVT